MLVGEDLLSLPLSTRNVLDVLASTSGVVYTTNAFGAQVPNFGGTAVGSVNTTRDGLTTNDGRYNSSNGAYSAIFTSPDMVEEVCVSSNNIDPEPAAAPAQVQMGRARARMSFMERSHSNTSFRTLKRIRTSKGQNYANRNQFGRPYRRSDIKNKIFFFVTDDQRYMGKITQNTWC